MQVIHNETEMSKIASFSPLSILFIFIKYFDIPLSSRSFAKTLWDKI